MKGHKAVWPQNTRSQHRLRPFFTLRPKECQVLRGMCTTEELRKDIARSVNGLSQTDLKLHPYTVAGEGFLPEQPPSHTVLAKEFLTVMTLSLGIGFRVSHLGTGALSPGSMNSLIRMLPSTCRTLSAPILVTTRHLVILHTQSPNPPKPQDRVVLTERGTNGCNASSDKSSTQQFRPTTPDLRSQTLNPSRTKTRDSTRCEVYPRKVEDQSCRSSHTQPRIILHTHNTFPSCVQEVAIQPMGFQTRVETCRSQAGDFAFFEAPSYPGFLLLSCFRYPKPDTNNSAIT